MQRHKGFTLIELSIVLVIIGLVVGGVFVGRDLIKAAEIRSTISELEKMNTAMITFRVKYNGLPGDLDANKAAQFGLASRSGADGHGDGDGQLEGCSSASSGMNSTFGCETALIWRDLSGAQLIAGSFDTATDSLISVPSGSENLYFPKSSFKNTLNFTAFSYGGYNFLFLGDIISTNASGQYSLNAYRQNFSPPEAQSIDSKIDDGLPFSGSFLVATSTARLLGPTVHDGLVCSTCVCGNAGGFRDVSACAINSASCIMLNNAIKPIYNTKSASSDSIFDCQIISRLK